MTAGLVTSLNPVQDLTNIAPTPSTTDSGTSFSDALKASTDNRTNSSKENDAKAVAKEDKSVGNTGEAKEDKSTDTVNNSQAADKNKIKTDDTDNPIEDTEEISEEDVTAIAEVIGQIMQTIAEVLDIPVEKVEDALNTMQLEATDLLDASNITDLVIEITDAESPMDIMTDEELYADVKAITEKVNDAVKELSDKIGIEPKEVVTVAKNIENEELIGHNQFEEGIDADTENVAKTLVVKDTTSKEDTKKDSGEQHGNAELASDFNRSVIDNLKESINDAKTVPTASYTTNDMENILNQVQENLRVNLKEEMTEMEMNLHPASLGNVKVQVAAKDGVITANFMTQNETVKAAIESQIVELRESMNEQGIKVEAIEVTVASHAFDENLSKEGEHTTTSDEEAKKKKIRSINLNDDMMTEDEETDDEIRIAKDMMARNGNTVDYLA